MYEQINGQEFFNPFQNDNQSNTGTAAVPQFASWKDLIDSAVAQNAEVPAADETTFEANTVEPMAPGADLIGDNARAVLVDDMLADAVRQIEQENYSASIKDLHIVLELDKSCSDAQFLLEAVGKRARVISTAMSIALATRRATESVCALVAKVTSRIAGLLPTMRNHLRSNKNDPPSRNRLPVEAVIDCTPPRTPEMSLRR